MNNPTPLSPRQVWVLLAATAHELVWGIPTVAREIEVWRRRAEAIPDPVLREDALSALVSKRFNPEGAALFAVLSRHRNPQLVRLLVAFQVILDYLDTATEREAPHPIDGNLQMHLALVEALEPAAPISDYYRAHPWKDDGGYLAELVQTCRQCCLGLPSFERVSPSARRAAMRCGVQGLNHIADPRLREATLQQWAREEFADAGSLDWWELTAAASSTLAVHALLALAADPACSEAEVQAVDAAYMPWICAASTMLDSYVDQSTDLACGGHSYIAHYPAPAIAVDRLHELVGRSMREAGRLRDGCRHALIVSGMVAMYLSSDDARTPTAKATTRSVVEAGGSLTRLLLPILRLWRVAYARYSM